MVSNITKISDSALETRQSRPTAVPAKRTAILVLGMHRSGTSAMTRVLNLLGADLPANLMLPKEDNNEVGFWESLDAYALNDEILESAGSSWDDWREFNAQWIDSPLCSMFGKRALQVLEREFSKSPLFVLKDPRMCRLMPFWSRVFDEFGAEIKCVLPLRRSSEVAASLKHRDGFSSAKSQVLWLRHVLDAEHSTRNLQRVFVSYDELLDNWRTVVGRMSRELDLGWPRQSATAELDIDGFLDEIHRHHRIDDAGTQVAAWVRSTSKALGKLLSDPHAKKAQKRLDSVRDEFNRASEALGAVLLAEERVRHRVEHARGALEEQLTATNSQLEQRNRFVTDLEKAIAKLEEDSQTITSQLVAANSALADRDGRIAHFEEHVAEQLSLIDELSGKVSERDKKIFGLEGDAAHLNREIERTQQSLDSRFERVSILEAQLLEQTQQVSHQAGVITDLTSTLATRVDQMAALGGQLKDQTGHVEGLTKALVMRDEQIAALDGQLKNQTGHVEELTKALVMRDEQIAALGGQLKDQTGHVEELTKALVMRDEQIAALGGQLKDKSGYVEELTKALVMRDEQIVVLDGQLKDQAGHVDELIDTLTMRDERIAGLAEQAASHALLADELRSTVVSRDERISTLTTQLAEQADVVDALHETLAIQVESLAGAEHKQSLLADTIDSLNATLAGRDAAITERDRQLQTQVILIGELNSALADRDGRIDELNRKRVALETAIERAELDAREAGGRIHTLEDVVRTLTSEIDDREERVLLLNARRAAVIDQRNRALSRLNALQSSEDSWVTRLTGRRNSVAGRSTAAVPGLPPRRCCGELLSRQQRRSLRRQARLVTQYGLFDEGWYIECNPEVVMAGYDPLWHWLTKGVATGRDPHPLFSTNWYLSVYPDVADAGMNPLEHFLRFGGAERRNPHPLFDTAWYMDCDAIGDIDVNPLVHFLRDAGNLRRNPHPLFDISWYLERNPDVEAAGINPLVHYVKHGAAEGRDPHPLFLTRWYLVQNPDIAQVELNPLVHYLEHGWREHRDPNALFNTRWYLAENPDVVDAGIDPLIHYIKHGAKEGRDPNPFFDTNWYMAHNPDLQAGNLNPLAHYLCCGGLERRDPGPLFNTEHYLKRHPEVTEARENPLVHFLANGGSTSDLKEVWPDYQSLRGAAQFLSVENKQALFQPSERYIVDPDSFSPKVTVVVPNYNHARYLRQRLDCIYAQTYGNFHVILLDDCSTDESREILLEYRDKHPERTTILFNEQNSGGVFQQWRRGIANADSALVWIAESDDYCDENFLSELVPYFMDEAVMLAYSRSVFVDETGHPSTFAFENYLAELSPDRWKANYVSTAHEEVALYLGRKNTIPNVSSAVFRKPDLALLFQDDQWLSMKICGDWIFYLHLLHGGKIAFSVDTNNYFRFHTANSSARTYSQKTYYKEHEAVAFDIARLYRVPDNTIDANRYYVERFFNNNAVELIASGCQFADVFDAARIEQARAERKPNLLMAAFAISTGGGEVFPIRLANYLKKKGYAVTFFNFMGDSFNPVMRQMLRTDIPLVERSEWCPDVDVMLEQFGIEVMHTHHASVDVYLGTHGCGASVAKHVVTMHGMYEAMSDEIFDLTLGKIGSEVAAWVYIADKNLRPFHDRRMQLPGILQKIGNGMDRPTITHLARADYGVPDDAFLVCLASRAIPQKGWMKAVEIVGLAREHTGRDIHLLLLGDGPVHDEMTAHTQPCFVHLLGFRQDVVDFYAMSDLGLLPTTFEGESFPLSVIECFMAGRPMLVSDIGEVKNMLSDGAGNLAGSLIDISSGVVDVIAVASELARLVDQDEYYLAKRATAVQLAGRFEFGNVASAYERVYANVTGGTKPHTGLAAVD